jgi:hypothetical protein
MCQVYEFFDGAARRHHSGVDLVFSCEPQACDDARINFLRGVSTSQAAREALIEMVRRP